MHGSDRVPDLRDYKRAWVGKGKPFNESEMALFSECSLECARKVLDTADIVREAMLRQLTLPVVFEERSLGLRGSHEVTFRKSQLQVVFRGL